MEIIVDNKIPIKEIENVLGECFDKLKDNDGEHFNDEIDQNFREWFGIEYLEDYLKYSKIVVAKEGNIIVGISIVGMQNPLIWVDGRKYEIFAIGVLPEYRNKGVGKGLLLKSEEVARNEGAENLILDTHELMEATRKFYLELGYKEIGVLEGYYGNGNAVFYMKKL